MSSSAHALIDAAVEAHGIELLALRRDLHAHPELSWNEQRTTEVVAARLEASYADEGTAWRDRTPPGW